MRSKNGIAAWLSVLAGLQTLSAATVWADWLPLRVVGALTAIVAAMTQGTAVYVAIMKPLGAVVTRDMMKLG